MKNALIICASPALALFEETVKKSYNVVSVRTVESGEILSKDLPFDLVISDGDLDPSVFPASTVVLTKKRTGAYLLPKIDEEMLSALLGWIAFSDEKTEKIISENTELQKKIDDFSIIGRAKSVLMKTLGMTENEAHKYIEKSAMESRVTKSEIAKRLLATYDN